jgi:hypothetical protein
MLGLLLLAGDGRADVVSPPPDSCPAGAEPNSCHGGPYCHPRICTGQSDCQPEEICQDTQLCILEIDCGGMGGPYPQDSVTGSCPGDVPCDQGQCETVKVCVPASGGGGAGGSTTSSGTGGTTTGAGGSTDSPGPIVVDSGCGCRLDRQRTVGWWALVLTAGAVGLWLRRRSLNHP